MNQEEWNPRTYLLPSVTVPCVIVVDRHAPFRISASSRPVPTKRDGHRRRRRQPLTHSHEMPRMGVVHSRRRRQSTHVSLQLPHKPERGPKLTFSVSTRSVSVRLPLAPETLVSGFVATTTDRWECGFGGRPPSRTSLLRRYPRDLSSGGPRLMPRASA